MPRRGQLRADAPSIYDIPKVLHREGLDAYVVRRARPAVPRRRLDDLGRPAASACTTPSTRSTVALVGKYIDLPDAYLSSPRPCKAGGFANWAKVNVKWVPSDECETRRRGRAAGRRRRHRGSRRLRHPRHRGQDSAP
jgi:CTP synthase